MSRIITIYPAKEIHRYGFESTQAYRARIARHLGQSDAIRLFRNKAQLIQIIEEMEQADYRQSNAENIALATHYSLGTVAQSYRELLDRKF